MKGITEFFNSSFNEARSKDVGIVASTNVVNKVGHTSLPIKGEPNSVYILKENGKTIRERYYNEKGEPYLDIDYTNHGNNKEHKVPHQHKWSKNEDGDFNRGEAEDIDDDERNIN